MKYAICFLLATFLLLSNLQAQEITMFPGLWGYNYYEDENRIKKKQVAALMSTYPEANELWNKSKREATIGWISYATVPFFFVWNDIAEDNNKNQTAPIAGIIASAGVAIGFLYSSIHTRRKAILKYNKKAIAGEIKLVPTSNGLGLAWSF